MNRDSPAETDDAESSDERTMGRRAGESGRSVTRRERGSLRDGDRTAPALPAVSRRDVVKTGALAGLGALGAGASASAAAQPASEIPSYEEAAADLSHPDPAEEAVALYRYLHDVWGEQILSGQQHETWGIDEIDYVESVTGRRPAVKGVDFIHGKARPVDWAIDWWEEGGITKAMWHWGVPSQETPTDEYEQSQNPNIDLQSVLEEGTEANQAFYDELDEVAAELQRAGDAGVPLLFGPFHEFEGEWFWWGMEGPAYFVELWETVHEYFVHEWDLDNLVWLLPHMDYPDPNWVPDESTFDLAGADTYDDGDSYQWLYENVTSVHGEDRPVVMHEIGSPGQPPDPEAVAEDGTWWSMWVNWHTSWLEDLDDSYLDYVYNHELTATLEDVPDVVAEYGASGESTVCGGAGAEASEELSNGEVVCSVDGGYRDVTGDGSVTNADVTQFFRSQHVDPWNSRTDLFDFTGDDEVSQADVVDLFQYVSGS